MCNSCYSVLEYKRLKNGLFCQQKRRGRGRKRRVKTGPNCVISKPPWPSVGIQCYHWSSYRRGRWWSQQYHKAATSHSCGDIERSKTLTHPHKLAEQEIGLATYYTCLVTRKSSYAYFMVQLYRPTCSFLIEQYKCVCVVKEIGLATYYGDKEI